MKTYRTNFGMIVMDIPEITSMQFGGKRLSYIKFAFDANPDAVLEVGSIRQLQLDTDLLHLLNIGYIKTFEVQVHPIYDHYVIYAIKK